MLPDSEALAISNQYYDFVDRLTVTDFENNKVLGKFYTNIGIAENMIDSILSTTCPDTFGDVIRVIDPFCGDGRLIRIFLEKVLTSPTWSDKTYYVEIWDIDNTTVQEAERLIIDAVSSLLSFSITASSGDAFVNYRSHKSSFDICLTNPPWGILKPQKRFNAVHEQEDIEQYKVSIAYYDTYMKDEFALSQPVKKFGSWGTNLGRCGTELALSLIADGGICGVVSPASLFNDQVSAPLRKWIYESFLIESIVYYPAELKLYGTADVSSITMVAQKEPGKCTPVLSLTMVDADGSNESQIIDGTEFDFLKNNQYIIPFESGFFALDMLMELKELPNLATFCKENGMLFTREIDETRIAEKLLSDGEIVFAKGYMVNRFSFEPNGLYINEQLAQVPESVNHWKIVWRDVSRNSQKRRMIATLLPPGYICGNSLGVIWTEKSENFVKLKALLAIMNSIVFEFQARSLLVTNHVSAGIIKQIRIPEQIEFDTLATLVDERLSGIDNEFTIEAYVADMYSVSEPSFTTLMQCFDFSDEEMKQLAREMHLRKEASHMIYNHYAAKLSDLDMQIVHCVPPGGNWKDIPESIPSQRLVQIRESYRAGKGSRSTYYGRLRPELPAYTVNTYFNRPGNGCNMHYAQDRTLSQREAARLQTFPDSFEFKGSLTAVNNQIGNAVPVLLAYQIAKEIPFKGQFVDLFCGAGGLALGFVWAGWKPIIANDIDSYAIETHRANIAEEVVCGDINSDEVFNNIVEKALKAKVDHPHLPLFVLGGPPCQGFSTANTRRGADDMRNWLFKSYVKIVKAINPEGFVFENVKGITNLEGGRFFTMIQDELKECVEEIKVNKVNVAEFAIPQRRERVIIIGGKRELVQGFSLHPQTDVKTSQQLSLMPHPMVIGVKDALDDLPKIEQAQDGCNLGYRFDPKTPFQEFMRGFITAEDYLNSYRK